MADRHLKHAALTIHVILGALGKLQNWGSDTQTPSLECISAESREINRLGKQIC